MREAEADIMGSMPNLGALISAGAERLVNAEPFMDALSVAWRVQRRAARRVEGAAEPWLRLWGLPTRSDVAALANQVAELERELRSRR
jgi:hypothetical protein